MDKINDNSMLEQADRLGIKIYPFDEVLEQGTKSLATFVANDPKSEDLCMFSYTSGTTGSPKGVQLSQQMLIYAAHSVNIRSGLTCDDSYLSYLPLAHSFE